MSDDGYKCEEGAAELWLAGALSAPEEQLFLDHLRNGCSRCEPVIAALKELPAWLAASVAHPPPPALAARIDQIPQAKLQPWREWGPQQKDEVYVVREGEGEWTTVKPGVRVKQLFADPVRDEVTMLIRMEPGSSYPPHEHGGPEQCLVVEGQLIVGGLVLGAGDFQCAPRSSLHQVSRTETGCVLFIVSSQRDRLLV